MTSITAPAQREALRQQMLLRALWRDAPAAALTGWVRAPARASAAHGVATYQNNGGAVAERALASAYPTVAALVGETSFAALARHYWQQYPPTHGDLGQWGDALPTFIAASPQLTDEPFLADSARLDAAVHAATRAADADNDDPPALDRLAETDPASLWLQLAPGAAVITSRWPVASIWHAHHGAQAASEDRFTAVREAFAAQRGECAWVWRDDRYVVHVDVLDSADATFTTALAHRQSLALALDAAGATFAFDRWLARALHQRWLLRIQTINTNNP